MSHQHRFGFVQPGLVPDSESSVMKSRANPPAYVVPAVIGKGGAKECQWQHLRKRGDILCIKYSTHTEKYRAGYEQADAKAGFKKCDDRYNKQCVLSVLVYPFEEYISDDSNLAGARDAR